MNFDDKKASGRTTRMLDYAFNRSVNGQETIIFGNDTRHAHALTKMIELRFEETGAEAHAKITVCSAGDLKNQRVLWGLKAQPYDYQTGVFQEASKDVEYVFDHSVMEYRLSRILRYLESTQHIGHVTRWLADTAMALTILGRKVYIVTGDPRTQGALRMMLNDYPSVSIENDSMIGNLNWLTLSLERAHPNAQLLFDPALLRRRFAGALATITRWDK